MVFVRAAESDRSGFGTPKMLIETCRREPFQSSSLLQNVFQKNFAASKLPLCAKVRKRDEDDLLVPAAAAFAMLTESSPRIVQVLYSSNEATHGSKTGNFKFGPGVGMRHLVQRRRMLREKILRRSSIVPHEKALIQNSGNLSLALRKMNLNPCLL